MGESVLCTHGTASSVAPSAYGSPAVIRFTPCSHVEQEYRGSVFGLDGEVGSHYWTPVMDSVGQLLWSGAEIRKDLKFRLPCRSIADQVMKSFFVDNTWLVPQLDRQAWFHTPMSAHVYEGSMARHVRKACLQPCPFGIKDHR